MLEDHPKVCAGFASTLRALPELIIQCHKVLGGFQILQAQKQPAAHHRRAKMLYPTTIQLLTRLENV
jgi:predicted small integral membrane protein